MSGRTFEARPAVREQTPILFGIAGASGGGKTYSALRAAKGIVEVLGGEIYFVDTDNRRALQYADVFKKADGSPGFIHVPFSPPHGSEDYVAAIRYCLAQPDLGCLIVDSMSHEHEGIGGLLDFHEREHARLGGRDSTKALAWAKPKAARRKLLLEIQRLTVPAIFCFRAKEGVKPMTVPKDGGGTKTEFVQQGFTPIAGDEFVFEMTLNALLMPASGGVPEWNPQEVGERKMTKLPEQFRSLKGSTVPIDEELGRNLAKWARGGKKAPPPPPPPETDLPPAGEAQDRPADDPQGAREIIDEIRTGQPRDQAREERLGERGFSGEGLPGEPLSGAPADGASEGSSTAKTSESSQAGPGPNTGGAQGSTASSASRTNAGESGSPTDMTTSRGATGAAGDSTGSSSERTATGSGATASSASRSSFGFDKLADALAEAKDWPEILEKALKPLTAGHEFKDAGDAMKARARAAVFHRLDDLMKGGLRFDYTADLHAFRCYIEFEDDAQALKTNAGAFKLGRVYVSAAPGVRDQFDKAIAARLETLEPPPPAGDNSGEGDFN
jgi:hypothetical protein